MRLWISNKENIWSLLDTIHYIHLIKKGLKIYETLLHPPPQKKEFKKFPLPSPQVEGGGAGQNPIFILKRSYGISMFLL